MILWKSKESPLSSLGEGAACRWIIEVEKYKKAFSFGLYYQFRYKPKDEWYTSHSSLYEVVIGRYFSWGEDHMYYDGPHCSFSLGFIHFHWSGNFNTGECKKCYPEQDSPCFKGDCKHKYHKGS